MDQLRRLGMDRQEADHRAVRRGTLQHEILEGDSAAVYVDGENLEIHVSCRSTAGRLDGPIPYALVTTLEVDERIGIQIYEEVRAQVHAQIVQVAAGDYTHRHK